MTCSYDGYADADGDADASTHEWFIDGVSVGTDSTLEGVFVGGDSVTCTVTPNDGTDTGTALSAIQNISNTAPELADVTLSPDPAYEADTLNCTPGTTTDVDGTTSFTYSYRWTVNGGDPGETSSQLTGDDFSRGDTVLCSVRPNDGSADGDSVDSNTLTIGNTAPEVSGVSIDPVPPFASDVLLCGYTFADEDGDSDDSTIAWTVNGTDVGSDTTLSGAFVYGDEVTCAVTAYDGTDEGNTASATVTIDNTAPVLADVTLSPDPAFEADTLTCTPVTSPMRTARWVSTPPMPGGSMGSTLGSPARPSTAAVLTRAMKWSAS